MCCVHRMQSKLQIFHWNLWFSLLAPYSWDLLAKLMRLVICYSWIHWWHFGLVVCGSALVFISKVTLWWARLVLGWVTGPGFNSQCQKSISVYKQPPRSTQPGHPSVDRLSMSHWIGLIVSHIIISIHHRQHWLYYFLVLVIWQIVISFLHLWSWSLLFFVRGVFFFKHCH